MNAPTKITTMSSREFNQDTAKAKRAAQKGPVFVTTRGTPTHVLMTKEEFDRLNSAKASAEKPFRSLADALAQTEGGDFDYEFPELKGSWDLKIPDFDDA